MRLRFFIVLIGALVVVAAFTFRTWSPVVQDRPEEIAIVFPGLPLDRQDDFASLPPEQQRAYLALYEQNADTASRLVTSALEPRIPLPEEDQQMLEMNAPLPTATGRFIRISPILWGQGRATLYRDLDGIVVLRFDDFSMPNGPDLRVALSAIEIPETVVLMREGETPAFEVGPLLNSFGGQNYSLPEGIDVTPFRSIVIYSAALDLIYTYAPLSARQ